MNEYENEQMARRMALDYYLRLSDALTHAGDVANEGFSEHASALASALWEQALQAWEAASIVSEGLDVSV